MKKKLILITLIGGILSVLIYFYTQSDELTLVSIGDGLAQGMTPYNIEGQSFNDYLKEDFKETHTLRDYYEYAYASKTIKELIFEIKENKMILFKDDKIEIQHAINDADILTIAIGMDELKNKDINNQVRNEFANDMEELLSMVKMLNNKKVIVLGLYTMDNKEKLNIEKLNAIIRDICTSNNFIFLDINPILTNEDYYLDKNSYYINYLGHKAIYEEIKKLL